MKRKTPPAPLIGSINLATLMEFEAKTPGTKVCTCDLDGTELAESNQVWAGGEHLMSPVPGTDETVRTHYYPDHAAGVIIILSIETVEQKS